MPTRLAPETVPFFISQSATVPPLFWKRISLMPLPVKSPVPATVQPEAVPRKLKPGECA
ncbi:MAG: hypothetical protein ACLP1W_14420 [Rhodomicrobium sp.]